MMETVAIEFAKRIVAFRVDGGIASSLRYLFRHHHFSDAEADAVIVLRATRPPEERVPMLASFSQERFVPSWHWEVPSGSGNWLAERLFYRIVHPVLFAALPKVGIARLQGALITDDQQVVAVLGDRGHGKTTTAAGWIDGGGRLVTDKTILVTPTQPWWFGGIYREMHLAPQSIEYLSKLPHLVEAEEYLPGRERLRYDWISHLGEQFVRYVSSPTIVIDSNVSDDSRTRAWRLTGPDAIDMVERHVALATENAELAHSAELVDRLCTACVWRVEWGNDVLSSPAKHYGFIRDLGTRPHY